jgi:hypothetical protein
MNAKQIKAKYNLAGVVSISYDGSGDSGYLEEATIEPERDLSEDAIKALDTLAEGILESRHGGWEINEGSCGTIKIDFDKNTIEIEHNERIEQYETSTDSESF